MKTSLLFILMLLAFSARAMAGLAQVATLSTSAAATIVVPAQSTWFVIIQNVGANAVNLTFDGGSTFTVSGTTGTDPTTTSSGIGYVLPAAQSGVPGIVIITRPPGGEPLRPIRAIMQTGTTKLNIITPDTGATFPTS